MNLKRKKKKKRKIPGKHGRATPSICSSKLILMEHEEKVLNVRGRVAWHNRKSTGLGAKRSGFKS